MGNQRNVRFDGMAGQGQGDAARTVSGRDGCGDSVDAAAWVDRTALSEGGQRTTAAGNGEDAADLLLAAVVQFCRTRRRKMRFTIANRCGVSRGWSWATRWCRMRARFCAFATCWSAMGLTRSDLRFDHWPAGRTAAVAALGYHRGRNHHRGAEFDQERECDSRPGDEADPQGQELALRNEAAHRSG